MRRSELCPVCGNADIAVLGPDSAPANPAATSTVEYGRCGNPDCTSALRRNAEPGGDAWQVDFD